MAHKTPGCLHVVFRGSRRGKEIDSDIAGSMKAEKARNQILDGG
jgi:hypothetical protein